MICEPPANKHVAPYTTAIIQELDAFDSDQSFSDVSDDDSVKDKDYTQPSSHSERDEESEIPSPRKQRYDMVQRLSSHVGQVFALDGEDEAPESTAGWLDVPKNCRSISSRDAAGHVGARSPHTSSPATTTTTPHLFDPFLPTTSSRRQHVPHSSKKSRDKGMNRIEKEGDKENVDDPLPQLPPSQPSVGGMFHTPLTVRHMPPTHHHHHNLLLHHDRHHHLHQQEITNGTGRMASIINHSL